MALFKHDTTQNAIIKEIQVINERTRVTFPDIVQRDGYNCTPKAMKRSVPFMRPKDEKQTKLESRTMHKGLNSLHEMRCNMFCPARVFVLCSYMHVSYVFVLGFRTHLVITPFQPFQRFKLPGTIGRSF
ncbi:hypothetical protein AVEN_241635-1 [Araneus ventricosus]|uniref:Uncharacterized protein n=1 Tax=Araneus ventricosus TaxID=182803 RepID=A0A4Y2W435_ARAVE|nr:hypothetical protein AVEN_241635-1 [Araneus ventricosus]